jgi:DNA-binding response OmpR family regulator
VRLITILLVEDVIDQLDLYELVLRDAGYHTLRATRGELGYEVAVAIQPDLVVLDLSLPDMDGWIVRERLQANPTTAAIPVIVLTARDDYDLPLRASRADVVVLHKPCSADRLLQAVERAVGPSGSPRKN